MNTKILKTIALGLFLSFVTNKNSFGQPGTLDSSFDIGLGFNFLVASTLIQNDGKIIAAGIYSSFNGDPVNGVVRLNPDGSKDSAFDSGTGANNWVLTSSLQQNGQILIGGQFTSYNGTPIARIARLHTTGLIDSSFNPGTGPNFDVDFALVQQDQKIVIGGLFTFYDGYLRNYVTRINYNGTIDTTFNPAGTDHHLITGALQPDGKILIGGKFNVYDNVPRNRIARLNTDGSIDLTFDPGLGADSWVHTITVLNDGRIMLGGDFTSFNGLPKNNIVRLNTNGSVDTTFNAGTGPNGIVRKILLLPDGKLIIAGQFTSYNGTAITRLARLNPDGTLDSTFNPGLGANHDIFTASLQPDGKVIIGGWFTSYDNSAANYLARINNDISTSIPIKEHRNAVSVSPNPFSLETSIRSDKMLHDASLLVYNSLGQRLDKIENINGHEFTFQRDQLPNGVYFVVLIQAHEILSTNKILINN